MLTLLKSIFLFGLTYSWELQREQEIGCFVDGRCEESPFINFDTPISDANACLLFCNDTDDCQYFTYQTSTQLCIAYSDCVNLTSDSCNDCISGDANCPLDSYKCYLPGLCEGIIEDITFPADKKACRGDCLANEECEYFSFDAETNVCLLTSTCEVDESCQTCVYGKRECIIEGHDLSKILIIGGYTYNGHSNDVEIVDMSSPFQTCDKPPNYPIAPNEPKAAMIDGVIWVCGGGYTNVCYNYKGGTWTATVPMNQSRYEFAQDLINDGTEWWITGGLQNPGVPLETTEILRNGQFYFGPDLPVAMYGHCLVTINNTHVFLAGGRPITTNIASSLAYIIDFSNGEGWQPVENMAVPRDFHICHLINTEKFGPEIVVMGGSGPTTEIFSPVNMTWRAGPNFPQPLISHETVSYKDSFLSIGGYYSGAREDFIYYFNTTTWTWTEEVQTMALGRSNFAALMLDKDMVHCG